jgi:hypothetical protein
LLFLPWKGSRLAGAGLAVSPAPTTWLTGGHTLPAPFRRSPDEPM